MVFTIKYKTMGMSLVAGVAEGDSVASVKRRAAELITIRKIKQIEYAAIMSPEGTEAALLNVDRYNQPDHLVEWLTVHG